MNNKLYQQTENGGMRFTSQRMGQVRIPNYVYDIWLPIIGATALSVYGVYCRLEREGTVKSMTLDKISKACRIGKQKLIKINNILEQCQFIKIKRPQSHERLMHWTLEINVLDPPTEVSQALIDEYGHPSGYEVLSLWLVESPEVLNRTADSSNQNHDAVPNRTSNVVSLGLHPSNVAIEQNQNSVLATQRDFLDEVPDLETAKATEPEDDLLFDNINENRKARGRRAMHREFASLPQKRVWRESTRYLMGCDGGIPDVGQLEKLKEYITQALIAERTDRAALISYIAKCAENQRTGQRSSHGPSFGSSRQDVGVHIPNEKHNLSEVLK